MLNYDLHSHSTVSDGTLSPSALVRRAWEKGVDCLALTDHDEVAGIDEAGDVSRELGIELLAGVEISVSWGRQTIHIVGLNIDPENEVLLQGLERLRAYREWRGEAIGRRLEKAGIPNAYAGAVALRQGDLLTRTHYGRLLVKTGAVETVQDAFKKYLLRGKPGYVGGKWATLEEALGWIHAAGGVAVVAHPARYGMTRTKLRAMLGEFIECGGEGLEVVSSSHNGNEIQTMAQHAIQLELAASRGSDFHDPGNHWVELGRLPALPKGCEPIWGYWNHYREQMNGEQMNGTNT